MIHVESFVALAWFATVHLAVTVAFTTSIVGTVLRQRAVERLYRQRLALWAAAAASRTAG